MYCSLAYDGLFAKFWSILAIYSTSVNGQLERLGERTNQGQCPPRVFCRDTLYQHICLRRNNGGVDEAKKEETTNKRTYSIISRLGVFPLQYEMRWHCHKNDTNGSDVPESNS